MKSKILALLAIMVVNCMSASTHTKDVPKATNTTHTEIEQLTLIQVKYGNNPEGIPVLHYAILQNDIEAVDLLLKYGASPFTKNTKNDHYDCLYYCIKAGSLELFKKFVALGNDPVRSVIYFGEGPLGQASSLKRNDIVKFILESYPKCLVPHKDQTFATFQTMLDTSASNGNYELFTFLLKRYKDLEIDYSQCAGRALHIAQLWEDGHGYTELEAQMRVEGKLKILDTLVENGLFTEFADGDVARGALSESFPEALSYLLDHKILHPNDVFNNSPILLIAARNYAFANEMVDILIANGVDVTKGNCKYVLFQLVREGGFSLDRRKELIVTLIQAGIDINQKDQKGGTVLSQTKDKSMIEFLVSLGAK